MSFPDSSKKAPNVFLNTYDSTGSAKPIAAGAVSSVAISSPAPAPPPAPIPTVYIPFELVGNTPISSEFFTSVLYPIAYIEYLTASGVPQSGSVWEYAMEYMLVTSTPVSGTLDPVIVYTSYNNAIAEPMTTTSIPLSGTLTPTIQYIVYNGAVAEPITTSSTPLSGTLQITIQYVEYTGAAAEPITITSTPLSGTLT